MSFPCYKVTIRARALPGWSGDLWPFPDRCAGRLMALQTGDLPEMYCRGSEAVPGLFKDACSLCMDGVKTEILMASTAVSSLKTVRATALTFGRRAVEKTYWLPVVTVTSEGAAAGTWITAAPRVV